MEAKDNVKKSSSVSGLRIEHVSGSVESPTEGTLYFNIMSDKVYTFILNV